MAPAFCRATLNYVPDSGLNGGHPCPVEVDILDARQATDLPGWETNGFELATHTSAVDDWTDDDEIAATHYAEIEELARKLTGADHALVSDHVKRNAETTKREREQAPVRLVHSDFADDYEHVVRHAYHEVHGRGAATLARSGLTAEEIERAPRIVMMQFWRNLGAPKMDLPVAFCDARTVTKAEVRPFLYTGYVAGGRSFNAVAITEPQPHDKHDWYAYPELTAGEVVSFRTYDTDMIATGETYFTPHSAFPDPDVEPGNPPRFSIELRVMCLFG